MPLPMLLLVPDLQLLAELVAVRQLTAAGQLIITVWQAQGLTKQ